MADEKLHPQFSSSRRANAPEWRIFMNWVAPIKDEKTLQEFKDRLKQIDQKYYIMFEIGVGTGMQLQDILKLKVKDILDKKELTVTIGTKGMKTTFKIPKDLQDLIKEFTKGKPADSYVITGFTGSNTPLSREQVYRVYRTAGKDVGLSSIGAQTMRKTFAWKYNKETGEIYYLQNLFNHASPSITYRYIGEKPNVSIVFKKMTASENERCRRILYKDNNGKNRIHAIVEVLNNITMEIDNPANSDAFYGRVDTLLNELEELIQNYSSEQNGND